MAYRDVYILGGRRTPIGALGGSLASVAPGALAGSALRSAVDAIGGLRAQPPVVVLGSAIGRGNIARYAALDAGLAGSTPAWTVNAQCTSGLSAIRLAAEHLRTTSHTLAFAGGVESCSQADILLGARTHEQRQRVAHAPAASGDPDMGPAADATAAFLGISRADQDDCAIRSYERAWRSRAAARFALVLSPVATGASLVTADDLPRRLPALDRLRRYPPAFGREGTVTVGNAAPFADAAAVLALGTSGDHLPIARILGCAVAAGDPNYPALAVVPAVEQALTGAGLSVADIGCWEVNEAFAVKVVAIARHLAIDPGRLNVNGGAIAFGHPFGASGAITLLHLVHELHRSRSRFGVAAIAGAGGLGEAMVIERFAPE